jgi:hypothetical protein
LPKILILQTYAHKKIWEGDEFLCHYASHGTNPRGKILRWEPDFLDYTINDITHAIGLYRSTYFVEHDAPRGRAYCGTLGENHPSLLRLTPINPLVDAMRFARDTVNGNGMRIEIAFQLIRKYENISREQMIDYGYHFLALKRNQMNISAANNEMPLCFTVDISNNDLNQMGFPL